MSSRPFSSAISSAVSLTSLRWRGFNLSSSTVYSRSSFSSPLSIITFTSWRSTLIDLTSPTMPSGVLTFSPTAGSLLFRYSYVSCSYLRQHISLPHTPDIFVGLSDKFCSFAIFIDTGTKSERYELQHNARPHIPIPPIIFVSSLTPIWRSSILVLKTAARSFTRSLKSILPSAVK